MNLSGITAWSSVAFILFAIVAAGIWNRGLRIGRERAAADFSGLLKIERQANERMLQESISYRTLCDSAIKERNKAAADSGREIAAYRSGLRFLIDENHVGPDGCEVAEALLKDPLGPQWWLKELEPVVVPEESGENDAD